MKLSGWKAKQLSFAGRVMLSKAVIEAVPIYPMMSSAIPKKHLNEIQKLQRSFIWGEEGNNRKAHLIGWDIMMKPKGLGGLAIRNLELMNKACLMKLGWKLRHEEEQLWGQVLIGKYGRNGIHQNNLEVSGSDSSLWKNLAKIWPILLENEVWAFSKGVER